MARTTPGLPGNVHSDLLVHTEFSTVHLLLEFWQSAKDRESAPQNAALRAFTPSLRAIALSHLESRDLQLTRQNGSQGLLRGLPLPGIRPE